MAWRNKNKPLKPKEAELLAFLNRGGDGEEFRVCGLWINGIIILYLHIFNNSIYNIYVVRAEGSEYS